MIKYPKKMSEIVPAVALILFMMCFVGGTIFTILSVIKISDDKKKQK